MTQAATAGAPAPPIDVPADTEAAIGELFDFVDSNLERLLEKARTSAEIAALVECRNALAEADMQLTKARLAASGGNFRVLLKDARSAKKEIEASLDAAKLPVQLVTTLASLTGLLGSAVKMIIAK